MRTRRGGIHALVKIDPLGTSTAYPVLIVLDIRGTKVKKIAELYGFYDHTIPERLWDVNKDGNTEIIHVGSSVWPPGKPHADVILLYEIMEYRSGKYVPASADISKVVDLNKHIGER